jgi:hypothetical protein
VAVVIPIVSEFDGKGVSKAIKEFQQLGTTGEKAQFALKKAAVPAAAALGGLAFAIGDATKAAIEDAKAQALLAQAIEKNTLAGEANVKAAEAYIEATMMSAAVADDQLRPALATLVQTTGDLTYSQELLNTSLDISAATGTDLSAVTDAVAKAYAGNTKALATLIPSLRETIREGASLDQIMAQVAATVGGAASVAANSAEGQMKRLSITLAETKESIGAAFLPILERLLPVLQNMAKFVQENTDLIVKMIVVVGSLAAGILALNAAMKVYNATMIVVDIATKALTASNVGLGASFASTGSKVALFSGVVASLAITFDGLSRDGGRVFKDLSASIAEFVNLGIAGFEALANSAVLAVNYINRAFNAISPIDVPLLPEARLPRLPDRPFGTAGGGAAGTPGPTSGPDLLERSFLRPVAPVVPVVPVVPPTAGGGGGGGGGGAAAPRTGLIDELFDILPIDEVGGGGGGFGAAPGNEALLDGMTGGVTVVVNAAIAESTLADKIVDALTEYNRRSGPLQLEIA